VVNNSAALATAHSRRFARGTALEKDKERRYVSAAELAADIRRFLRREPIAARPAGTFYQLRRFSQRHKRFVAGVAFLLVVLISALIHALIQRDAARLAHDRARLEADRASALNEFLLNGVFRVSEPRHGATSEMTVPEMLDNACKSIDGAFIGQPAQEGLVRSMLGRLYLHFGLTTRQRRSCDAGLNFKPAR